MGFWSTLAKIGGVAAAPFTGGASLIPTLIGVGGDIAQSVIAHKAEKKGAQQQMDTSRQAAQVYAPFYQQGAGAANTLAGYLGVSPVQMPSLDGMPMGAGPQMPSSLPWADRIQARDVAIAAKAPHAAGLWTSAAPAPHANTLAGYLTSRPQTPSAKSRSSYRAEAQ